MAPSPYISTQLRQLIYYHLDNNLVRNALFLAGRLHAYEPRSSEASYLLALCYLQNGQPKAAWEYSRNFGSRGTHVGCSYVFAQACLDLGKYLEGITALERSRSTWATKNHWNKHNESRRQHIPDAPAVLCLLGKLWQAHKDINKAVECYVESLKLNPFIWDAFLGLCETGVNIRVPNIYKLHPDLIALISSPSPNDPTASSIPEKHSAMNAPLQPNINPNGDPFASNSQKTECNFSYGSSALWEKLNGSTFNVSSTNGPPVTDGSETAIQSSETDELRLVNNASQAIEATWEPPLAPSRKNRTIHHMEYADPPPKMKAAALKTKARSRFESEDAGVTHEKESAPITSLGDRKRTISGQVAHPVQTQASEPGAPQRRSVRLFNQIRPTSTKITSTMVGNKEGRELKKVKATGTRGRATATTSTVGRVVSGNRKHGGEISEVDCKEYRINNTNISGQQSSTTSSKSVLVDRSKEIEAVSSLLELFAKLANGYFSLTRFRCPEAIQAFNSLPQSQRETPWVLSQLGKAYYEQALYVDAEKYFLRVKTLAPSQLEDMEIYSTVLWHLKNEVELAYLAHEMMAVDRLSPQAWCAVGNSFSRQREHDQALKCFKRATQLDPKFAYAFTLQGHEYVANEEYDKALEAYRHGVSADSRHYNAWYGLGTVYEKMGKLAFAEQHFRNAATINPTNAVLVCCIGLVLEKMNNPKAALVQYGRASSLAPQSALARFRKARALMKLQELKLAMIELKVLKDLAPDEPNVHYLLGKLYKLFNDKSNAIKHFTTALNLDPKAAQYIKDAMETLDGDEDDDDEDMA